MIKFAEKVLSYAEGLNQDGFIADGPIYDATLHNIQLIGEAATHVPDHVREANSEIEWRRIIGTRSRVTHAYLNMDEDVIWDIIQTDIPSLLPELRKILEFPYPGGTQ